MRKLYLIRHAEPERAEGGKQCISRTDLALSLVGREQVEALHRWGDAHPMAAVYSSPAARCRETALALCTPEALHICPELWEVDVGEWEGLTFEEIRRRWPQEYAARGEHLGTTPPPGGESLQQAGERLDRWLKQLLQETDGDLAVVSHAGILRGWLCPRLGMDPDEAMTIPQPWGGITAVELDAKGWRITRVGIKPTRFPGLLERQSLLERCATPEPVQAHSRAVAAQAAALAENARCGVDMEFLRAACLLHDICRTQGREHPALAEQLLRKEGYPELAEVVGQHQDLGPQPTAEAELLYLADKLVCGTEAVELAQRFGAALRKCTTPQALDAWARRYQNAKRIAKKYGSR